MHLLVCHEYILIDLISFWIQSIKMKVLNCNFQNKAQVILDVFCLGIYLILGEGASLIRVKVNLRFSLTEEQIWLQRGIVVNIVLRNQIKVVTWVIHGACLTIHLVILMLLRWLHDVFEICNWNYCLTIDWSHRIKSIVTNHILIILR